MSGFILDWFNLAARWAHLVVGIGWIGTSFYFIALDLELKKRERMNPGVYGTAWLVHGGGFYHVEKYMVAPSELPPDIVWYKWEAYLTWVTGFSLLILQYYFNARLFLIDPNILEMAPSEAVLISVLSLGAGWLIYDRLCKSPLVERPALLAVSVFALILGAAYLYTHVYSPRGAFIHVGAFIGTIMAVNVFGVIIPNQRKIVASLIAGEKPDPALGRAGKQRSLHNNYLTLPVLLMMVSNHYPMLTGHPKGWLVVGLVVVTGGAVRHFLNRHDAHDPFEKYSWTLPVAAVAFGLMVWMTWPKPVPTTGATVSDAQVMALVNKHCTMCHAAHPTHQGIDAPPKGLVFDDVAALKRYGAQIEAQAVQAQVMPLGNETGMTEAERRELGAWIDAHR
ncbi:urate hydroxylase PuuD [Segnochrobactrum spirostomi]|uniref:Urate hydroxylase PuuD n=1 Tax=Segnochrobactrum spirostomi TaxID=2608987 RepID=A0A6A7XXF4_9HYPH|nr:urate hydroxylase PuuD [Segnochrobactrum spirostomi]MQT11320.1 urate hydroxylase PuuD [Segnochrobactrum spirostomi]